MSNLLELFILKNAAITAELNEVMSALPSASVRGAIEIATDKLVADHLQQIDKEIKIKASRMSEFYKIFYMVENDIRILVRDTLEEAKGSGWWDQAVPQNVRDNARKNKERESNEGLTPRSQEIIDYTTFGELGEIINNNWDVFTGIFGGSEKSRVLRIINRLNLVRGPIAHCSMFDEDEIVRLKLFVRDWYKLMG